jgi:hypothetical protein
LRIILFLLFADEIGGNRSYHDLVATSGSLQGLTRLVVGPDLKLVQHVYLLVQLQGFMISTGYYCVAYEASFCLPTKAASAFQGRRSCWLDFDKETQAVRFLSGPQEECTPKLCYFRGVKNDSSPELASVRPGRERRHRHDGLMAGSSGAEATIASPVQGIQPSDSFRFGRERCSTFIRCYTPYMANNNVYAMPNGKPRKDGPLQRLISVA